MTSDELYSLFRETVDAPDNTAEYAYEVRNGAGFDAGRSCDAMSIGTWPSRGLCVDGYEFKVSRADWLRELKSPAKADAFFRFCDRWWLAVGDAAIVANGELPQGWGLLAPNPSGKRLSVVTQATKNPNPEPWTSSFRAAVIKRFAERGDEVIRAEKRRLRKEVEDELAVTQRRQSEHKDRIIAELTHKITTFQVQTGLHLDDWWLTRNADRIKQALSLVADDGIDTAEIIGRFRKLRRQAALIETDLGEKLQQMEAMFPSEPELDEWGDPIP